MSYSACLATSTINLGCASNVGGIKTIYVLPNVTGATTNIDDEIISISGSGNAYEFAVQKQTSSLTETLNSSLENGTTFWSQQVIAVFHKIDADKRNQLKLLAVNRGIKLIVEDNNGSLFYLGGDFGGGFTSTATGATGTAFGDKNGYDITFDFFSKDPMRLIDGSLSTVLSGITLVPAN